MGSATEVIAEGLIEHDGMLWKPRKGATATAEEFVAARTLFIELNHDATWNPWIRDEREADIDSAAAIIGQRQRAEPGHRHLSLKQWEAHQARRDRQREKQRVKDEALRERGKSATTSSDPPPASVDQGPVAPRLRGRRVGRLPRRHPVPAMDSKRRERGIKKREKVERLQAEIERLTPIVGDPEDAVDEHGWLPCDRREHAWWSYRLDLGRKVRDLEEQHCQIWKPP